ncbi:MAG: hypothetical protein K1X64_06835 [Myxococcaceae bacterium]|nr:hypothetical protein [Myxococcaceae bacterium]
MAVNIQALPLPRERALRPSRFGPMWVVWVLLLLVFVLMFIFVSNPVRVVMGAGAAVLVTLALFVVQIKRWETAHLASVSLMNSGELGAARLGFKLAAGRSWGLQRTWSVYHLGIVELRAGNVARALELFGACERGRTMKRVKGLYGASAAHIAFCFALKGDVQMASQWLETVQQRRGHEPVPQAILAEVMVLAMQGHFEAVANMLEPRAADNRSVLGPLSRLLNVLRAYAQDRLGNSPQAALTAAQPYAAGDFDFAGAHWPDFAAFLARQGLTTKPQAAG